MYTRAHIFYTNIYNVLYKNIYKYTSIEPKRNYYIAEKNRRNDLDTFLVSCSRGRTQFARYTNGYSEAQKSQISTRKR